SCTQQRWHRDFSVRRGSACGYNQIGCAVEIDPVAAEVAHAIDQLVERTGLHDIPVRAVGIGRVEVGGLVRCREDDDGNCREAGLRAQLLEEYVTMLVAKMPIEQY